jgi:hypothetical protein
LALEHLRVMRARIYLRVRALPLAPVVAFPLPPAVALPPVVVLR